MALLRYIQLNNRPATVTAAAVHRTSDGECGMTLVEVVISAGLLAFGLAVMAMFLTAFVNRENAMTETDETAGRSTNLETLFGADFAVAGTGLARAALPETGTVLLSPVRTGDWESIFNQNYESAAAPGQLNKQPNRSGTNRLPAQMMLAAGSLGYLEWQPEAGASFVGLETRPASSNHATAAESYGFYLTGNHDGAAYQLFEGGAVLTSSASNPALAAYVAGDRVRISLEVDSGGERCVRYSLVRGGETIPLAEANAAPPAAATSPLPLAAMLDIHTGGGRLSNITLTGSALIAFDAAPPLRALLPFAGGSRLPSPIKISGAGGATDHELLIVAGDANFDSLRTRTDFPANLLLTSSASAAMLPVTRARRGRLQIGDYLLLIDFRAARSALLHVGAVSPTGDTIEVRAVQNESHAAWNLLSSEAGDYNYTFPAGCTLVRLTAPVGYRYDAAQKSLWRREGGGASSPWTLAALGISDFTIESSITPYTAEYTISYRLANEGIDSSTEAAIPQTLRFAPPELNYRQD